MRKIASIALAASSLLVAGCPRNQPQARRVSVTATLPSSGLNCVTVQRNPRENERETLDCIDSVVVSAPANPAATVSETLVEQDQPTSQHAANALAVANVVESEAVDRKRKVRVSVSETVLTVDTLYCPQQAVANVVETLTTIDQLICGGT